MSGSSNVIIYSSLTPRVDTECERCLRRLRLEKDNDRITGLLSQLFWKQAIAADDIFYSKPETLKALSIKAIELDITPTTDLETRNYVRNIKNIYFELKHYDLVEDEKTLLKEFLRCHYQKNEFETINKSTSSRDLKIYDEGIAIRSVSTREAPLLLQKNPVQWLFRMLNPRPALSEVHHWKEFIHPHVLVLCYKSCMSTEALLENIHAVLTDKTFSKSEKTKHTYRIIDLLVTWLNCRYYNHELSEEPINNLFQIIFSYLEKISKPGIKSEVNILKVLFDKSRVVTPRRRESFALSSVEQLFTGLIHSKRRADIEKYCKSLVDELTSYFLGFVVEIPIAEYFGELTTMKNTPKLLALAEGINALEAWCLRKCQEFATKDKSKVYEALICAMTIARRQKEYQTAFSLKNVFNQLVAEEPVVRLSKVSRRELAEIEKLFNFESNIKFLREEYTFNDAMQAKYFPVLPFLTRDLNMISEKPLTLQYQGIEIFSIGRLNLIFKTIYPIVNLIKNAALYLPKTNLKFKIELEYASAESSGSIAPTLPALK